MLSLIQLLLGFYIWLAFLSFLHSFYFVHAFPDFSPHTFFGDRIFFYLTGIGNLLFLAAIVLILCFIENGMSRGYGRSERLVLTIKQYHLKDIAQILVVFGTTMVLPFFFSMTMWEKYDDQDAFIMIILVTITSVSTFLLFVYYSVQSGHEQVSRISVFSEITNSSDGRLLPAYYPEKMHENDGITYLGPADFNKMYAAISKKKRDALAGFVRTA